MRHLAPKSLHNNKGLTLVELMIVVAIVGILASISGVAYFRQVKRAKIAKLEQFAMDAARGQEEFGSRHGLYFPVGPGNIISTIDTTQTAEFERWQRLLGFSAALPEGVQGVMYAGEAGEGCGGCDTEVTRVANTASAWWVVEFNQDMSPGGPRTRVLLSSNSQQPVIVNEGE